MRERMLGVWETGAHFIMCRDCDPVRLFLWNAARDLRTVACEQEEHLE